MDRSRKSCKKVCGMCFYSPQNILVLACDHTVCLQCAYVAMTHRSSDVSNNDIEFNCAKCHQITYFDRDLIKQIEANIQLQRSQKQYGQSVTSKSEFFGKQKPLQGGSFIEKMRNQYFSQKPPVSQQFYQKKKSIQNQQQNFETKIKTSLSTQKYSPQNKNSQNRQPLSFQNQNLPLYKEKSQDHETKKQSKPKSSIQTKCKAHPYYELIYFCMDCREVVCPQCLLRGQHKDHQNQSVSQILEKELPYFINQTSEKFLKHVNQIQSRKQEKLNQLNEKLIEIKSIRQNAEQYFMQVRRNLQKEEGQVLEKCDQLLKNLKKEEKQNLQQQKQLEQNLSKNFNEIKALKSFYKEFSSYQQCDTSRKTIEKSLIHKYLSCLRSVNSFLATQRSQDMDQIEHKLYQKSDRAQNSQIYLTNESQLLNRRISEGIKSIRQSLVFESFSRPDNFVSKQIKKQTTECQSRITTKLEPFQQKKQLSRKLPHQNQYISYISTQNSQTKSKQNKGKSREKSASISPYKGQISRQKIQLRKSVLPFKKPIFRETTEMGKENVPIQDKSLTNEMKTQISTQNVSAKKYHNGKNQKLGQKSKQKQKNSQITKSKKRNSISYNSNVVNRFKL